MHNNRTTEEKAHRRGGGRGGGRKKKKRKKRGGGRKRKRKRRRRRKRRRKKRRKREEEEEEGEEEKKEGAALTSSSLRFISRARSAICCACVALGVGAPQMAKYASPMVSTLYTPKKSEIFVRTRNVLERILAKFGEKKNKERREEKRIPW